MARKSQESSEAVLCMHLHAEVIEKNPRILSALRIFDAHTWRQIRLGLYRLRFEALGCESLGFRVTLLGLRRSHSDNPGEV